MVVVQCWSFSTIFSSLECGSLTYFRDGTYWTLFNLTFCGNKNKMVVLAILIWVLGISIAPIYVLRLLYQIWACYDPGSTHAKKWEFLLENVVILGSNSICCPSHKDVWSWHWILSILFALVCSGCYPTHQFIFNLWNDPQMSDCVLIVNYLFSGRTSWIFYNNLWLGS